MVDLPSGKMKSREGTVVDADDLMQEMVDSAKAIAQDLGKLDGMDDSESELLYEDIGMGALKYFMLKVDPKKRMLFDPQKSPLILTAIRGLSFNTLTLVFKLWLKSTTKKLTMLLRGRTNRERKNAYKADKRFSNYHSKRLPTHTVQL